MSINIVDIIVVIIINVAPSVINIIQEPMSRSLQLPY